jgi:hypothetical protein
VIATLPAGRRTRTAGPRLDVLGHPVRIVGGLDRTRAGRFLAERERTFATFLSTSELTGLNRSGRGRVEVSELLARTLAGALAAAVETNGLVSPVVGADREQAWRAIRVHGLVVERPPGLALDLTGHVLAATADALLAGMDDDGSVGIDRYAAVRGLGEAPLPAGGGVRFGPAAGATYGLAQRPGSAAPWREITVVAASALQARVAAEAAARLGAGAFEWLQERGLASRLRGEGRVERRTGAWLDRAAHGSSR